jgi:hypothetical protein
MFRTTPIKGDSSPIWDHTASMEAVSLSDPLVINLRIKHSISKDTDVGSVHIHLRELTNGVESVGWYDIRPAGGAANSGMRLRVALLLAPVPLGKSMIAPVWQQYPRKPDSRDSPD